MGGKKKKIKMKWRRIVGSGFPVSESCWKKLSFRSTLFPLVSLKAFAVQFA